MISWPVIGVALQKNYISVYISVGSKGAALLQRFAGRLGELRMGESHFCFVALDDLDEPTLAELFREVEQAYVWGKG